MSSSSNIRDFRDDVEMDIPLEELTASSRTIRHYVPSDNNDDVWSSSSRSLNGSPRSASLSSSSYISSSSSSSSSSVSMPLRRSSPSASFAFPNGLSSSTNTSLSSSGRPGSKGSSSSSSSASSSSRSPGFFPFFRSVFRRRSVRTATKFFALIFFLGLAGALVMFFSINPSGRNPLANQPFSMISYNGWPSALRSLVLQRTIEDLRAAAVSPSPSGNISSSSSPSSSSASISNATSSLISTTFSDILNSLDSSSAFDTDVSRLISGKLNGVVWAMRSPCPPQNSLAEVMVEMDLMNQILQRYSNRLQRVLLADDMKDAQLGAVVGSLYMVDGGQAINSSLSLLRMLASLGVRSLTLVNDCNTPWAQSHLSESSDPSFNRSSNSFSSPHRLYRGPFPTVVGLNADFGRKVISEMNRLGMMIDLSQASVKLMHDVLDVTETPVIFSHSNARSLCNHSMNVPDSVLDRLRANDGVINVFFYPPAVSESARLAFDEKMRQCMFGTGRSVENCTASVIDAFRMDPKSWASVVDVVDHIDYVARRIGARFVGVGGGFDSDLSSRWLPSGLTSGVSASVAIWKELRARKYLPPEIEGIMGGNFLRVMRKNEDYASKMSMQNKTPSPNLWSGSYGDDAKLVFNCPVNPVLPPQGQKAFMQKQQQQQQKRHVYQSDDGSASSTSTSSPSTSTSTSTSTFTTSSLISETLVGAPTTTATSSFSTSSRSSTSSPPSAMPSGHMAVAADHSQCSSLGHSVLVRGGHAVDAAVATALCVGVVHPAASGIGGGGFMTVFDRSQYESDGTASFFDFREVAPAASTQLMFINSSSSSIYGGLASGVPGELRGLWDAHQAFGLLPWCEVVLPAAMMAYNGWSVDSYLARVTKSMFSFIIKDPLLSSVFAPNGIPPIEGDVLFNPRLGQTLFQIAQFGADYFYSGALAETLVNDVRGAGGILTLDDLQGYRSRRGIAQASTYRGMTILGAPPPAAGAAVFAQTLNVLELLPLPPFSSGDANVNATALDYHYLIEAFKWSFSDRSLFGDPAVINLTGIYPTCLSKDRARFIFDRIIPNATLSSPSQYTNVLGGSPADMSEDHGTTHFAVVDRFGNAISMTSTVNLYFGSLVMSSSGVILNNQMDDFATNPKAPNSFGLAPNPSNYVRAGARPLSSSSPMIILHPNSSEVFVVVGAAGGSRIPTSSLCSFLKLVGRVTLPEIAILEPRVHHQLFPNVVFVERGLNRRIVDALRDRGHQVNITADALVGSGGSSVVQMIVRQYDQDLQEWVVRGASDPRRRGFSTYT